MYTLRATYPFRKSYQKIVSSDKLLQKRIKKALLLLSQNPFYPSLRSHRANTRKFGIKWSSFVTGDVRIIWDFDKEENLVLLILDIGKHSGKYRVYQ